MTALNKVHRWIDQLQSVPEYLIQNFPSRRWSPTSRACPNLDCCARVTDFHNLHWRVRDLVQCGCHCRRISSLWSLSPRDSLVTYCRWYNDAYEMWERVCLEIWRWIFGLSQEVLLKYMKNTERHNSTSPHESRNSGTLEDDGRTLTKDIMQKRSAAVNVESTEEVFDYFLRWDPTRRISWVEETVGNSLEMSVGISRIKKDTDNQRIRFWTQRKQVVITPSISNQNDDIKLCIW